MVISEISTDASDALTALAQKLEDTKGEADGGSEEMLMVRTV
jgi:hypothetical protein